MIVENVRWYTDVMNSQLEQKQIYKNIFKKFISESDKFEEVNVDGY